MRWRERAHQSPDAALPLPRRMEGRLILTVRHPLPAFRCPPEPLVGGVARNHDIQAHRVSSAALQPLSILEGSVLGKPIGKDGGQVILPTKDGGRDLIVLEQRLEPRQHRRIYHVLMSHPFTCSHACPFIEGPL